MGFAKAGWEKEKDMLIHTYTHDTDYPILLLRDIQLINTECTPCKYRTDVEPT